ncbi:MAG: hypothetical protein ACK526_22435 [Planctomyces sp.]
MTWPSASLQARLWERMAFQAGNHLDWPPRDGRHRHYMARLGPPTHTYV